MLFAETAEGQLVPILDYTRKEFRPGTPSPIQTLGSLLALRILKWLPLSGRRWLGQRSDVLKNLLLRDSGVFFTGPATYLAKLGRKVPHRTRWDKFAAGSVQSIESARRGYATARLESEALRRFAPRSAQDFARTATSA